MTDPVQPEPQGERLGVPAAQAGLSPSVEPLRVSPPVGASIPNAARRAAAVYLSETGHARIEHYALRAGLKKSAFLRLLIKKGLSAWLAEHAKLRPPTLAGRVMLQLGGVKEGVLFAALDEQWRSLRSLNLNGNTQMWIRPAQELERAGLVEARNHGGSFKRYRLTAKAIEAQRAETQGSVHESAVAESHSPNPPLQGTPNHG